MCGWVFFSKINVQNTIATYEYFLFRATSEILPSLYSESNPNSLDPALKLTSKLLGVTTDAFISQDDSVKFFLETGLGPFFFQSIRAECCCPDIFSCCEGGWVCCQNKG